MIYIDYDEENHSYSIDGLEIKDEAFEEVGFSVMDRENEVDELFRYIGETYQNSPFDDEMTRTRAENNREFMKQSLEELLNYDDYTDEYILSSLNENEYVMQSKHPQFFYDTCKELLVASGHNEKAIQEALGARPAYRITDPNGYDIGSIDKASLLVDKLGKQYTFEDIAKAAILYNNKQEFSTLNKQEQQELLNKKYISFVQTSLKEQENTDSKITSPEEFVDFLHNNVDFEVYFKGLLLYHSDGVLEEEYSKEDRDAILDYIYNDCWDNGTFVLNSSIEEDLFSPDEVLERIKDEQTSKNTPKRMK